MVTEHGLEAVLSLRRLSDGTDICWCPRNIYCMIQRWSQRLSSSSYCLRHVFMCLIFIA